jgi:hypothetical protein
MPNKRRGIRLCITCNLIFFILILLFACAEKKQTEIALRWSNQRVVGVSIPKNLHTGNFDSLEKIVSVRLLKKGESIAMMGNYKLERGAMIFEPLIPFTSGLHYVVLVDDRIVKEIVIPMADPGEPPVLLTIYPTQDTVPENLLKLYLHFSKPMREGESARYLTLLKNDSDTLPGVFLDLQPELWNSDRTMLTVWLDPGRIKRGLQPNQQWGAPLRSGEHYTLVVSDHWKDIQGTALTQSYFKKLIATVRDSLPPDPMTWTIRTPAPDTKKELCINMKSTLDYSLLNSALAIVDEQEKIILGTWTIGNKERSVSFIPHEPWIAGKYQLQVETRLEDLAGNNINRPFDVDLRTNSKLAAAAKSISLPFEVSKDLRN